MKEFASLFVQLGRAGSFSREMLRSELVNKGWPEDRIDVALDLPGLMQPDVSDYIKPN